MIAGYAGVMWRVLALSVLPAACGGAGTQATVDAPPALSTGRFTPLLCTGGNPGDPTCPITIVDLSGVGIAGARFELVVQPLGQDFYVTNLQLTGSSTLHVDGVYLEWWDGTGSTGPTGSVLLAMSLDGSGTFPSQALLGAAGPIQLSLRFDAVTSQ